MPKALRNGRADAIGGGHRRRLLQGIFPWMFRSLGLLVLVALAFLGVDVLDGLDLMLHAHLSYLIPAFLVLCLALLTRMTAWILLARALDLGYRRLRSYVKLFFVGWSAALGLPQGVTPLARAALLASDKRSVGRGVTVDIADRVLQVVVLLLLLLPGGAYLSSESARGLLAVLATFGIVAALVPLIWLLARVLRPLFRFLLTHRWAASFTEDIKAAIWEIRHASPTLVMGLLGLQILAALLTVSSLFLASRSLGVDLPYLALIGAFSAVGLTLLLPISINGLGPREGILTAVVAGAGFSSESGVALGLLWFAMATLTRLAAVASWWISSAEEG